MCFFEPSAERACLAQPRDAVARSLKSKRHCLLAEGVGRCGAVRRAGTSQARTGYAPTARCGTGLVRTTGRGAALLDDSSVDVGFSAGWLGAEAALPGI